MNSTKDAYMYKRYNKKHVHNQKSLTYIYDFEYQKIDGYIKIPIHHHYVYILTITYLLKDTSINNIAIQRACIFVKYSGTIPIIEQSSITCCHLMMNETITINYTSDKSDFYINIQNPSNFYILVNINVEKFKI